MLLKDSCVIDCVSNQWEATYILLSTFHTRNCASTLHHQHHKNCDEKKLPTLFVTHRVWVLERTAWPSEKMALMMSQERGTRSAGERPADDGAGHTHTSPHTHKQTSIFSHNNWAHSQQFRARLPLKRFHHNAEKIHWICLHVLSNYGVNEESLCNADTLLCSLV